MIKTIQIKHLPHGLHQINTANLFKIVFNRKNGTVWYKGDNFECFVHRNKDGRKYNILHEFCFKTHPEKFYYDPSSITKLERLCLDI